MANLIGQTLGGYRIVEQIGLGGMATVYKAYQPSMDRYVALKILSTHLTQDPAFVKRFLQEAKVIARLEHVHILPVHDHGEEDGYLYLVMRFIEAGTLKDRLAQGPLSLEEMRRIVTQVGSALDYAHRQGVVHRDLKPSNVLVDPQGDCYLTDFGIAKMIEGTLGLTGSSMIGTPHYMAPEQGQSLKVDQRADIYAMGVVIYEMVTGRVPFDAETPMAVALKHITEPLPMPRRIRPDLPEEVERVILKAMAKDPADRYQSMHDLATAFDQAVQAAPSEARAAAAPSRATPAPTVVDEGEADAGPTAVVSGPTLVPAWKRVAQRPLALLAAGGLVLAVLAGAGVMLSRVGGSGGSTLPVVASTATATPVAAAVIPPTAPSTPNPVRAFAEPILAAIANQPPTWSDDFGNPGSGWSTTSSSDGAWGYQDGQYFIEALRPGPDSSHCCYVQQPGSVPSFSDFVLEIDGRLESFSEGGFWSVLFRDTWTGSSGGLYHVNVYANGQVDLGRLLKSGHTQFVIARSPSIKAGNEMNHVQIIARGPRIAVYVNGEPALLVYDETVSGAGEIFLNGRTYTTSPLRVQFDNLKVWDISKLP